MKLIYRGLVGTLLEKNLHMWAINIERLSPLKLSLAGRVFKDRGVDGIRVFMSIGGTKDGRAVAVTAVIAAISVNKVFHRLKRTEKNTMCVLIVVFVIFGDMEVMLDPCIPLGNIRLHDYKYIERSWHVPAGSRHFQTSD